MKIRHVHPKRWIFPKKTRAITLYPFILYRENPKDNLERHAQTRVHEMVHVYQCERAMDYYWTLFKWVGWLQYYGSYVNEIRKHGYKDCKYEVAARRVEQTYLDAIDHSTHPPQQDH